MIIIPARLASTRLPGKVLLDIAGKSMLQRCWETACEADVGPVLIASEDREIIAAAAAFGAAAELTGEHDSGTGRLAAVIAARDLPDARLVLNLQADEPLLPADVLRRLYIFAERHGAAAASVCTPLAGHAQHTDPDVVKVVCDRHRRALYFSRAAIPRDADHRSPADGARLGWVHHGVYAYRAAILRHWPSLQPGPLEQAERLEQLRLLENGIEMHMLMLDQTLSAGVDTAADLERVRRQLRHGENPD